MLYRLKFFSKSARVVSSAFPDMGCNEVKSLLWWVHKIHDSPYLLFP
jgi:hypothetical protein